MPFFCWLCCLIHCSISTASLCKGASEQLGRERRKCRSSQCSLQRDLCWEPSPETQLSCEKVTWKHSLPEGEGNYKTVFSLLHECCCQQDESRAPLPRWFSAAPPLRVVSQKTWLISHPFSDYHLAIERAILSLLTYEELQNRIPTKVAIGPSQSLALDFPTSRSFYILLSQMTHGSQRVYTPPHWFISMDTSLLP